MFPLRPSSNLPTFLKAFLPDRKLQQLSLLSQHLPLLAPPGTLIVMKRHYISSEAPTQPLWIQCGTCCHKTRSKSQQQCNSGQPGALMQQTNKQNTHTHSRLPHSEWGIQEDRRAPEHLFIDTDCCAFIPPSPSMPKIHSLRTLWGLSLRLHLIFRRQLP